MVTVVQGKVCAKNHPDRLSRLATIHQRYRQTDRQTDGRTDGFPVAMAWPNGRPKMHQMYLWWVCILCWVGDWNATLKKAACCYLLQYLSDHGSTWSTNQMCRRRRRYGWQNVYAHFIYNRQFSWWIRSNSVSVDCVAVIDNSSNKQVWHVNVCYDYPPPPPAASINLNGGLGEGEYFTGK